MGIESGIGTTCFKKAFKKAIDCGFVQYDQDARLVYLPSFLEYNPPLSRNALKSWKKIFDELPKSKLQDLFQDLLQDLTQVMGEKMSKAYAETWG
jgi:hypothetical protein